MTSRIMHEHVVYAPWLISVCLNGLLSIRFFFCFKMLAILVFIYYFKFLQPQTSKMFYPLDPKLVVPCQCHGRLFNITNGMCLAFCIPKIEAQSIYLGTISLIPSTCEMVEVRWWSLHEAMAREQTRHHLRISTNMLPLQGR